MKNKIEIRKTLANNYHGKSAREVEKISREVFESLDAIVGEFEEFVQLTKYYDETGVEDGFSGSYEAIGSMLYKVEKGNKLGSLNIEFFAKFPKAYNKVKIELVGPKDNFDTEVVEKLAKKFRSFAEGE